MLVFREPYDGTMLNEILNDWQRDVVERQVASAALQQLSTKVGQNDAEHERLLKLLTSLLKFEIRHSLALTLDKALPAADGQGRRFRQSEYNFKAGGECAGRA